MDDPMIWMIQLFSNNNGHQKGNTIKTKQYFSTFVSSETLSSKNWHNKQKSQSIRSANQMTEIYIPRATTERNFQTDDRNRYITCAKNHS